MSNAISRITTYDFLGMFIPGSVGAWMIIRQRLPETLLEVKSSVCCKCIGSSDETVLFAAIQLLMFFAVAYVLGIIINWLADGIWRGFRNNASFIYLQAQKLIKRNPGYHWIEKEFGTVPFESKCLCHWIVPTAECYIKMLGKCFILMVCPMEEYSADEKRYYNIYYRLIERGRVTTVAVVESQVALLRNLLLPVAVCCFYHPCLHIEWWIMPVTWIAIFFTMVTRQNRVYSLILEDYQNYREMEAEHETGSNIPD